MTLFDHKAFTEPLKLAGMPAAVATNLAGQLENVLSQTQAFTIYQDHDRLEKIEKHLLLFGNNLIELQQSSLNIIESGTRAMGEVTPVLYRVSILLKWIIFAQAAVVAGLLWLLIR